MKRIAFALACFVLIASRSQAAHYLTMSFKADAEFTMTLYDPHPEIMDEYLGDSGAYLVSFYKKGGGLSILGWIGGVVYTAQMGIGSVDYSIPEFVYRPKSVTGGWHARGEKQAGGSYGGVSAFELVGTDAPRPIGLWAGPLLSPLPDPSTWTLMAGGFGIVGACMRRRRPVVRFT